jgi:endonuclease/exonuclease/phosphatase family metal-dependent hydrolase
MLRLLEYNVACFRGMAPLKSEPLLHFLLSAMTHLAVDIIVLVEMFDPTTTAYIVRHTPGWDWASRPHHASGLLVGARGRIRRATPFDLHARAGCCQFDCLAHKGALHCTAHLERHHRTVDIVGIHLQSCDRLCPGTRSRQLRHLRTYLDGARDHGRSLLLAGDFNVARFREGRTCPDFRRMCRTLRSRPSALGRTLQYKAWRFRTRLRTQPPHTLTTYPHHIGTGPGLLDHVLINGSGQLSTQVIYTPGHLSDHNALLCHVRLP